MRLFVILSLAAFLALTSGFRLSAVKRRRESKWDIIHHEYHGPPAPLSKDGRVIDTEEVAEAKANHLAIHAETVAELARLMAEANALEAKIEKESEEAAKKASGESEAPAAEAKPESAPIVAAPVEVTPELMAVLQAAAAEEEKQQQQQQAEEAPAVEAPAAGQEAAPEAPAVEAEPAAEAPAPVQEAQEQAAPAAESSAAEEPPAAAEEPANPAAEEKPVVENESANEIDAEHPITIAQRSYEGPLAPLSEDGRVVDTIEVRKAKEAHLLAYEQAVKLAKAKEERLGSSNSESSEPAWYEQRKKIFVPPVYLLYHHDGPIGYNGPKAPLGEDGRVKDTEEVERAKKEHKKAYETAEALAKRHPPKAEENAV